MIKYKIVEYVKSLPNVEEALWSAYYILIVYPKLNHKIGWLYFTGITKQFSPQVQTEYGMEYIDISNPNFFEIIKMLLG